MPLLVAVLALVNGCLLLAIRDHHLDVLRS